MARMREFTNLILVIDFFSARELSNLRKCDLPIHNQKKVIQWSVEL